MAQEQFAGPEHYTEFDPEKFIRDMKIMADEQAQEKAQAGKGGELADEDSAVDQPE